MVAYTMYNSKRLPKKQGDSETFRRHDSDKVSQHLRNKLPSALLPFEPVVKPYFR